ncbi:DUF6461 domain-containing protein [Streptomyces sp. NPDC004237]|uniref:DUF6461 domain-containing protein n=1 Tax=Streptomyces sp. NPDC004237 TaxID=3154455 RepID=UPI0033B83442
MMSTETLPNMRLYQFGYCTIFAKDVSPVELLTRASGAPAQPIALSRAEAETITMLGEDLTEDDLPDLDADALAEAGLLAAGSTLLRAGTYGDWSFVIETESTYLAADEILAAISHGTAALSLREGESGSSWIAYAENGDLLSSFDPLYPDADYGTNPDRLAQLTGYREAITTGERAEAFVNAAHAIQQALRCAVPAAADADRMPAIRIADGN